MRGLELNFKQGRPKTHCSTGLLVYGLDDCRLLSAVPGQLLYHVYTSAFISACVSTLEMLAPVIGTSRRPGPSACPCPSPGSAQQPGLAPPAGGRLCRACLASSSCRDSSSLLKVVICCNRHIRSARKCLLAVFDHPIPYLTERARPIMADRTQAPGSGTASSNMSKQLLGVAGGVALGALAIYGYQVILQVRHFLQT